MNQNDKQHRSVDGLMRLTWLQVEKINQKYKLLCNHTREQKSSAELVMIVKQGKLRFVEARFSGDIPQDATGQPLPFTELEKLDAKISSLCAYTEAGGEARLSLVISGGGLIDTRMALFEELCPAR